MKFLIIRFSSIGDIVLTTPVIRCLRKAYPEASIHFLTKEVFSTIVLSNPYIDEVLLLSDNLSEVIQEIKQRKYDAVIDLHHNFRTQHIKRSLKNIKFYRYNKLNIRKWVFTNFKVNLLPEQHVVQRYMATLKGLGVKDDGLGLDYFIPENEKVKDGDIPFSHSHGYVAIVIGAAHNTKKLPVEKLIQLVAKIEYPIILSGGKEDFEAGNFIEKTSPVKIYNGCGKFSLNESADIVRKAKLVISNDTGMMHIAAAFKKNIISIWGNTVPSFGMVPYKTSYDVFQVNKLACRPCSKTGYDECPLGHFKCMMKQDVDAIVAKVNERLAITKQ